MALFGKIAGGRLEALRGFMLPRQGTRRSPAAGIHLCGFRSRP